MPEDEAKHWLPEIIDLLRTKTAHNFTLYKPGTLQRRIERRMAMTTIETDNVARYLELLRSDDRELDLLAKDLLINVTSFFRDPKVFDLLERKVIPDLIRSHTSEHPLRIWVAGCSTGEETYSLVMLFREQIMAEKRNVKLQVFASDVDPDAIARAREGLYPDAIAADVSAARLARFFTKEDHGYRVLPDLRSVVVFTVQDVLADPPFSRIDLVSCRNLLIYLRPEAQAQVLSLFHFALREGGILVLGSSETVGRAEGRFEVISKSEQIYRHIGRSQPGELAFSSLGDRMRISARPAPGQPASRQGDVADLCRRLVLESYTPAAVLINRKHECLYYLGRTERYLHLPPGPPTHDLLAMAHEGMRTKLRCAIQRTLQENKRIVVAGGRTTHDGNPVSFEISVQPVLNEGEQLLLICFIDKVAHDKKRGLPVAAQDVPRVAELEQELAATQAELRDAIRNLEISSEEQKAINEEALSVNEEFQSTNEELLTSKEELQSLNEELTALNSQLHETLERQRMTSNDLQNILYSTNVATIFLDTELNIRFFTPATKSLFNIIPGDVGRPLADLNSRAADGALLSDALTVLQTLAPVEREIEAKPGVWYIRRISPYRTQDHGVEGVVVTFADITERRQAADALEAAKRQAERANVAKSRFLAAASHDLRQPLQTLVLIQGLLAKTVQGERARKLVERLAPTLDAMSGLLNTLLDINQIEAGAVRAEMVNFPIGTLLSRLRNEFDYHAQAQKLSLHAVACSLSVCSDPRLLEQMIRNLLSNAFKYTKQGKVLLGCRRRGGMLSIEVWDTGVGIPEDQLHAIFDEYYQVDNATHDRNHGLGLGLPIVQRLGQLLGHRVRVRSQRDKGSVFSIEVMLQPRAAVPGIEHHPDDIGHRTGEGVGRTGMILVVEDDPEVRELLETLLSSEGHRTAAAPDGMAALDMVARRTVEPDLILADYNLPSGMDGLQVAAKLRQQLCRDVPIIILTGDISINTLRDIARGDCVQLNKPVKPKELAQVIQRLLAPLSQAMPHAAPATQVSHAAEAAAASTIFIVDDDSNLREALRAVLEEGGLGVEAYSSCEAFLESYRPGCGGCLLIDAILPGMNGLALLQRLHEAGDRLPTIMITGAGDVPMAVQAMKDGASDFIEKPIHSSELLASIARALEQSRDSSKLLAMREAAAARIAGLTPRQRQIMELVLAGHPSKNIAADLGISQRTVENHRAAIMKATGSKSLPALARLALAADWNGANDGGE